MAANAGQDAAMSHRVPIKMRPAFNEIIALTDAFCQEHLDGECGEMCRAIAAALARKRPSPLDEKRAINWASGIVYVLCQVNFLFDKTTTPNTTPGEISEAFGFAKSTVGNRAKEVRRLLDTWQFDPKWTLPSRMEHNPMAWYIMVDGLVVDARYLPRELQEIAYEKGLIPYIPEQRGPQSA